MSLRLIIGFPVGSHSYSIQELKFWGVPPALALSDCTIFTLTLTLPCGKIIPVSFSGADSIGRPPMITIRDVAKLAGTSTATVSHVVNSTGRITVETRRRVLAAIKELRYYPNVHARSLASQRSRMLGMIVSDIENPFFPEVIKSFEGHARGLGYEVVVSDTNYEPALMKRAAGRMLEQKVGGVAIVTSEMDREVIQEILHARIAVVFLDLLSTEPGMSNIRIDWQRGMREAIAHLMDLGHRRIAYVAGHSDMRNIAVRRLAYTECMKMAGLGPGPILPGNQKLDGGFAAGSALLTLSPRPTAVIAMNDFTAMGVICALRRNGVRIPEDMSIVGFDRTQMSQYFIPSLTSVNSHPELVGKLAAEALHESASAAPPQGHEYDIPTELVVGESTGPVSSRSRNAATQLVL
jgi:LacI family transcriptional regulator